MSEWKRFLIPVAEEAGAVLMRLFNRVKYVERKKGEGLVTEADHRAEDLILRLISRKYPNSSIITEESGEFQRDSDLCWVIDPLDGTSNYAHGFPWFCVSIGLHERGKPKAGVIYHPVLKEMFYVEAGKGVRLNGRRVQVSTTTKMRDALLGTGFYYSRGKKLKQEMEFFARVSEVSLAVRRPGAAALDLAYVACGRYDGFWERGLSPWDVAAGGLMVTEAGGKISKYAGEETTIYDREILATNGKLHRSMTKYLQG